MNDNSANLDVTERMVSPFRENLPKILKIRKAFEHKLYVVSGWNFTKNRVNDKPAYWTCDWTNCAAIYGEFIAVLNDPCT